MEVHAPTLLEVSPALVNQDGQENFARKVIQFVAPLRLVLFNVVPSTRMLIIVNLMYCCSNYVSWPGAFSRKVIQFVALLHVFILSRCILMFKPYVASRGGPAVQQTPTYLNSLLHFHNIVGFFFRRG